MANVLHSSASEQAPQHSTVSPIGLANTMGDRQVHPGWACIGLIAGWLASAVVGAGYGAMGDVVDAFVGGFIFNALYIAGPFAGIVGTIFAAFIGAIVLLLLVRLIHRS